ncbi:MULTISPECIES: type VII secretion-associated serine protease mycosin [unclassified Streptomyces]|uniref:type VII secretion-associated serine protease mycosin n=1 Tax=unclassified Streptomyces TaxID=2593676 RepID=UPI00093B9D5D|nr:type VII secretion-associated serine protease mycosin [Streptomyces sp. TSRI0107]OKJ87664.1 serine protease [Streptomyces sp. TSRI0107]
MPTNRMRRGRLQAVASAIVGLLLVGGAATPAHADSTRDKQWFLDAMHAEEMWRTSTGESITVAVIDSGVDPSNPDLSGRVLDGLDLAPASRAGDEHTDYDGHGTGMAALIAGTGAYGGGNGAFGLAPGAKILPIRMPAADDGSGFETSSSFSKAIRYAVDHGARVVNISMGGAIDTPELTAAVRYAVDNGSLVFASVGNSGDEGNRVQYPGATPGVIGVASVGKDLRRSSFSQFGPQVDMAAPGEEMVHACGGKTGLCETEGTSDATALASASAALIWSKHPTWTNNQVLRVMLNTIGAPTDGAKRNDSIGYGIVRPRIALQNPGDPGPADVYPLPDLKAVEASAAPSASALESQAAQAPTKDDDTGSSTAVTKNSSDNSLWVALSVGTAALLAAVVVAAAIRRHRRAASTLTESQTRQ